MRNFRKTVLSIAREYYTERIPTLVGGDELTLAIDASKIDQAKLNEMLLAIRGSNEFNARLVVARADKKEVTAGSAEEEQAKRTADLVEHVSALRRAEAGVELAKKIEKEVRELRLFANQGTAWNQNENQEYEALLASLDKEGFIIEEKKKREFFITTRGPLSGSTVEGILDKISKLKK